MLLSLQSRRYLAIAGLLFANVFSARADVVHVLPALGSLEDTAVFLLGDAVVGSYRSDDTFIGGDVKVAGTARHDNNQDLARYALVAEEGNFAKPHRALASSSLQSNITLKGYQNITLSGGPGETVTLNLRNFSLRDHSTFTLQGTATTMFVINVSRQFSLSGTTRILFSDGVQWNHLIFNVQGRGTTVSLSGNSLLQGILNARHRTVKMRDHAVVWGDVVAARLTISGAAQVIPPPITSP